MRSGWSTSCDNGSMMSSPKINNKRPLAITAGVVPRKTVTWHAVALMIRIAIRPMRRKGKCARLCAPRRTTTGTQRRRRKRNHGFCRMCSWLSCRRNKTTVRRSCNVTAKCNCATNELRRARASRDNRDDSMTPHAANAPTTKTVMMR